MIKYVDVVKEVPVEVPVERIVEKIVTKEVPVEVEKIVTVERIVETMSAWPHVPFENHRPERLTTSTKFALSHALVSTNPTGVSPLALAS